MGIKLHVDIIPCSLYSTLLFIFSVFLNLAMLKQLHFILPSVQNVLLLSPTLFERNSEFCYLAFLETFQVLGKYFFAWLQWFFMVLSSQEVSHHSVATVNLSVLRYWGLPQCLEQSALSLNLWD